MSIAHPDISWKQLQTNLKSILADNLDLEIQQKYMHKRTTLKHFNKWGSPDFCIQFVTVLLNRENIWWFPKDSKTPVYAEPYGYATTKEIPHDWIYYNVKTCVIRYLQLSKDELLTEDYSWDYSGITEILRAADKRIGFNRLKDVIETYIPAAQKIFKERYKNKYLIKDKSNTLDNF